MSAPLDIDLIRQRLEAHAASEISLGNPITYLPQTGSTNDDAAAIANTGAPHGAIVIADEQRFGRGRLGRSWFANPRENLTFSIVLRPQTSVEELSAMTLAAGLGVSDAVAMLLGGPDIESKDVGIKWPNDVLVRSKKIAGILLETRLVHGRCSHVIAGFGINVLQTNFDPSVEAIATSLAKESHVSVVREDVFVLLLKCLSRRLEQFAHGGLSSMMKDIAARDISMGRAVRVGEVQGIAEGIDVSGALRVLVNGSTQVLRTGELVYPAERRQP